MQNNTVAFSRRSRTSRSTETSEHSTSLHESSHYQIVAAIATRKAITKKQAPSQTWPSQPLQLEKAHSISIKGSCEDISISLGVTTNTQAFAL
jgi:hypothetical protein